MPTFNDLTGQRFGRLVVQSRGPSSDKGWPRIMWNCVCDCGNTKIASTQVLRSGSTRSCGCLLTESARAAVNKGNFKKRTARELAWEKESNDKKWAKILEEKKMAKKDRTE